MYAILQTGGKQLWVEPGERIQVERLDAPVGRELVLEGLSPSGKPGTTKVTVEVVRHLRAPKVLVFKKRAKKGTKKLQGHRQDLTEIRVKDIVLN